MIKLNFAGDFVPIHRMANLDATSIQAAFSEVSAINAICDYSIVNMECPVVLSDEKPIEKIGPIFKTNEKGATMLQVAGFSCATLSNNHFYDYGETGVADTIDTLDRLGIDHVGGGRNIQEASLTLYKQIKDKRFAILNCSEREFATATSHSGGGNPLDPISQYYAIKKAREKSDFVIMIVHGGMEKYPYPTPQMRKVYRFLADAGADVVVSHHQHYHSGYELYKGKPIFYGLGNFCFDHKRNKDLFWNYGYMVTLSFEGTEHISFQIHPYIQCHQEVGVKLLSGEEKDSFFERLECLNRVIVDDEQLQEKYEQYLAKTSEKDNKFLSPYTSRWAVYAHSRGWLPTLFPKRKQLMLLDRLECDSQRERLVHYLRHKFMR